MSGPGEFIGYYAGKIGGVVVGGTYGGIAGAVIGEEVGGKVGSKIGKGLDNIIESQSKNVKYEYDRAIAEGMAPHEAIHYSLDVNGLND